MLSMLRKIICILVTPNCSTKAITVDRHAQEQHKSYNCRQTCPGAAQYLLQTGTARSSTKAFVDRQVQEQHKSTHTGARDMYRA
jgi:hypothetical protein